MTDPHAAAPPIRRWRCPDCGFANQWEAIECRKCGVLSPPDRERWEFKPFVRSDRERLPHGPHAAAQAAADRPLCATCGGNGVVKIPGGVSVCPGCHGECWASVRPDDPRWQRLYNLIATLAHPKGDHRQNDVEDEAHDLIRGLRNR